MPRDTPLANRRPRGAGRSGSSEGVGAMRTAMRTRTAARATTGALLLCLTAVGCGVVTSAPRGSGTAGLSHPSPSASTPVAGEPATGRSVPPAPVPQAKARGSEGWRISRPAVDHQIEAFTTATSGLPGTSVGLKVSTTEGGYEVSAYRIGAYDGGTGAFVWESGFRRGRLQRSPVLDPVATRTVVAPWRRSLTVDTERLASRASTSSGSARTPGGRPRSPTSSGRRRPPARWPSSRPSRPGRPTTAGVATASTRGRTAIGAATP